MSDSKEPAKDADAAAADATLPLESVKRVLPWLVAVAFFMEALDTTVLNTAVPAMAAALAVAPLSMKSVLTSYTLSLAIFIPVSGWVADRYGTRRVFAAAIGLFTFGSLLCGLSNNIHLLTFCRLLQGCGGAMMVPVGRLTMVRTFAKSELVSAMSFVALPALIGPLLGPFVGGLIVRYLHWRMIFFVNIPIGLLGLYMVLRRLPDYRGEHTNRLDFIGMVLFGVGIGLLSYVVEVFGEHTLSGREMLGLLGLSLLLLFAYWRHATTTRHPLLRLELFRIRTFRTAVVGSLITRLGIGGMPFLLPLLYQVGLGYSPVHSGLLIMPQSLAAMSLKLLVPRILTRIGYRTLLISNTIILGSLIALFGTIGPRSPVWLIVIQAFALGFFTSMQYTCMNTLVYADVTDRDASMASTLASTMQQMSMSFGVATASLVTGLFIADRFTANAGEMLRGIHKALLVLGAVTIVSSVFFRQLRSDDGQSISRHKASLPPHE